MMERGECRRAESKERGMLSFDDFKSKSAENEWVIKID